MPTSDQHGAASLGHSDRMTKALLACGVAYFVLYVVANDAVAATIYQGYDRMDQAISELSSKDAASRTFLIAMAPVFTALMVACGVGVWRSAQGRRTLRALGAVLVAWGVTGLVWIAYPMTSRAEMAATGSAGSSDVGHLALTVLTFLYIFGAIVLGAISLGKRFRWCSITTALIILATGAVVGVQSAGLPEGSATPWMGFIERVSGYGMLLWIAVLAIVLWRRLDRRRAEASGRAVAQGA
jgi:hypothetical protein